MMRKKKSMINGHGLFTDRAIPNGKLLGKLMGTPIQHLVNHSRTPNAVFVSIDNVMHIKSLRLICAGEEITVDYRHPLNPWKQKHYDFLL